MGRKSWITLLIVLLAGGIAALTTKTHSPTRQVAGPVRIRFIFPPEQVGRPQALFSAGQPNKGVIVFVNCPDPTHLEVGVDLWGVGVVHRSKLAQIKAGAVQDLVIEMTALYPLADAAVARLKPEVQQELRNHLRIELNGQRIVDIEKQTFDSEEKDISIGRSAIGGSLADAHFHGDIISGDRLPFQVPLALIDRVDVTVNADFEGVPPEQRQPLFSIGKAGAEGIAFGELSAEGQLRFGFLGADGSVTLTGFRPTHGLTDVSYRLGFEGRTEKTAARITRKGESTGDSSHLQPRLNPAILYPGINPGDLKNVGARFLGKTLQVQDNPNEDSAFQSTVGAFELFVSFPNHPTAQPEPLVVSGRTGAADMIYIRYIDNKHIAIGFDHWGVSGFTGAPMEIDPSLPHRITISYGALFPHSEDPFWKDVSEAVRARCLTSLFVAVDGNPALQAPLEPYPTSRVEIAVEKNPVGGSSCSAEFTGTIHLSRRSAIPTEFGK